jgi:hypothetical protein
MSLVLYLLAVLEDGDYENDWLTHLPLWLRPLVHTLGQALAPIGEGEPLRMVHDVVTCGDPTLPDHSHFLTLWHVLTRLYDLLLTAGLC